MLPLLCAAATATATAAAAEQNKRKRRRNSILLRFLWLIVSTFLNVEEEEDATHTKKKHK